jgi:hypothetical protein
MGKMLIHKVKSKFVLIFCFMLLMQTSLVLAEEEITGDWDITMEFEGQQRFATLIISKKEDGTLTGKWGSSELSNVKFQDGKLTFNRTVGPQDRQSTMDYEGTLKDGKLILTVSSDWGEFTAVGARPEPKLPVLGQWDINFNVGERDINAKLTITRKQDGTLEGIWDEEGEHKVSDVKFQDGKLTFTRSSKVDDFGFETTYEGTLQGDKLIGKLKGEMGEWQANGQRVGAALIGVWELTTTSDWGTRENMMKIYSDLTGRYETFGGEVPMKNIKLEGDQVTFTLEMSFRGETFTMDFKGKLDGGTLKGQLTSDRGTSDVVGKKIGKVKAATSKPKETGS